MGDNYATVNMSTYAGDEHHEYSTIINHNKESRGELMITEAQQAHVNKCSPDASEKHPPKTISMKLIFCMAVILAVVLFISLGAILLSIISFIASGSIKPDAMNNSIVSQLGIQLDALNSLAIIEQAQITKLHCGDGIWHQVAHINMSNPSHQCPSAWREVTMDGIRVCARPISTKGSCPGVLYHASGQYSKVCGRVIGYQFGSPSAFELGAVEDRTIDEVYVEGVSITHGRHPRQHIWSYAAGSNEHRVSQECSDSKCPCNGGRKPPSYVRNNYYCESAYKLGVTDCYVIDRFFPDDPLWDGQQCDNDEGTCCTGANTPPWFNVDLSERTSDDIEVRICHDQYTRDEDTPIQVLELYVQ